MKAQAWKSVTQMSLGKISNDGILANILFKYFNHSGVLQNNNTPKEMISHNPWDIWFSFEAEKNWHS